jgi:urea transporter
MVRRAAAVFPRAPSENEHAMIMPMQRLLRSPAANFTDHVLRGIGQVMLQNTPLSGLLFLIGIFVSSWQAGLYALFGTGVATATALALGAPRHNVDSGLHGLNGTLTGLGLATFLSNDGTLVIYVAVAAMSVTVVMAAIQNIVGTRGYPLTGPFILTTWIFIGAVYAFANVPGSPALGSPHLPQGTPSAHMPFGARDIVTAILNGVAQVMLQENPWTGAIFLVAVAVGSRISAAAALLGSTIAVLVAWFLGAAPELIRAGVYGFNAALTAMALGGVFFVLHPTTVAFSIIAVCFSTVLYGSMTAVLSPISLPALTAPFVVTIWLILLSRVSLLRLQALSPGEPASPEENLHAARRAESAGE